MTGESAGRLIRQIYYPADKEWTCLRTYSSWGSI